MSDKMREALELAHDTLTRISPDIRRNADGTLPVMYAKTLEALQAALARQGAQEPAMTLEVKKNSLYGKQYAILRPDLSLPAGLYPMFTQPQPAIPEGWRETITRVHLFVADRASASHHLDLAEELLEILAAAPKVEG